MKKKHNPNLTRLSQQLRREMTREERHLWYDFLKGLPVTIQRQKVVGPYIVDFYCASVKLVIEIDGSQHYENENMEADVMRDEYLKSLGLIVKRYSNRDIHHHFESVCEDIGNFIFPDED